MISAARTFRHLLRCERGVVALEYGLICAVIGVVIVSSLQGISAGLANTFNTLSQALVR
jgi:Flp pilus assembly pilin Flp